MIKSLLPLLLAGCATSASGAWPSLSPRPGETAQLVQRPVAPVPAARPAAVTGAPISSGDAASRLASVERDLTGYKARLEAQLTLTRAAASTRSTSGDATATAEVELTRLDRLGGQASDLRGRLDALAGDLARQNAGGADISALLKRTGAAIEQVEALRIEQAAAYAAARR